MCLTAGELPEVKVDQTASAAAAAAPACLPAFTAGQHSAGAHTHTDTLLSVLLMLGHEQDPRRGGGEGEEGGEGGRDGVHAARR